MLKHKIKLVISDIDGTLVTIGIDSLPSKKVLETVWKLREKKVFLCLSTSRSLSEAEHLINLFKLNSLVIVLGGSRIYDISQKKYLWQKNIESSVSLKILHFLDKNKIPYLFTHNNKTQTDIKLIKDGDISDIVAIDLSSKQIDFVLNFLKKYLSIHVARTGTWNEDKSLDCLHITHVQGTKQYAIYEVLKILKIDRKNVLGIGDRENDIPLLSACGVKVAMGNADPKLKEIADWIAPPVWEDGFASAMEKFVL